MATITAMAVCLRVAAVLCAATLLGAACSSIDGDVGADLDSAPVTTTATTAAPSSSPSSTTTTTTEPTTTTLSELQTAEAEVQRVVEAWFNYPFDSSKGEDGIGAEYLTGLLLQRSLEVLESLESNGQIQVSRRGQPLELTFFEVDLDSGFAEVDACFGPAHEILDAETMEVISADDPTYTTTSTFVLQVVDDGSWKISEWRLSRNTENPVECEISS